MRHLDEAVLEKEQADVDTLLTEIKRLREDNDWLNKRCMNWYQPQMAAREAALLALAKEACGFLSMADVTNHGITNIRCLEFRIDQALKLIEGGADEQR